MQISKIITRGETGLVFIRDGERVNIFKFTYPETAQEAFERYQSTVKRIDPVVSVPSQEPPTQRRRRRKQ